jgi:hypothetical protein
MTLRGRFGVIGSQRKVSGKVMGKYRKVLETPERF